MVLTQHSTNKVDVSSSETQTTMSKASTMTCVLQEITLTQTRFFSINIAHQLEKNFSRIRVLSNLASVYLQYKTFTNYCTTWIPTTCSRVPSGVLYRLCHVFQDKSLEGSDLTPLGPYNRLCNQFSRFNIKTKHAQVPLKFTTLLFSIQTSCHMQKLMH